MSSWASWRHLEPSRGDLSRLENILRPLGFVLGTLGSILEAILPVLEASEGILGALWAILEAILDVLETS